MASALTHAFAAVALTEIVPARNRDWRFRSLLVGSALLPDADVIGFALGIHYGDLLGHRGLSHSLLFAAAWSLLLVSWAFRVEARFSKEWWALIGLFFLATASHALLDALTNGGLGVAFFSPFDTTRYFFPWRPIDVSPVGVGGFFGARGAGVIRSELLYVWLPLCVIWICGLVQRKRGQASANEGQ